MSLTREEFFDLPKINKFEPDFKSREFDKDMALGLLNEVQEKWCGCCGNYKEGKCGCYFPDFKKEMIKKINEHFDNKKSIKFYYCESENSYLIGKRVDNFYYAHWYPKIGFAFDMSKYLPWGEHVVAPDTLWKEHTYPSEPKEIDFNEWIKGFIKMISDYNPPLKFEDLEKDMWVWHNEQKKYLKIVDIIDYDEDFDEPAFLIVFEPNEYDCYEEGRFYRKEVLE